MRSSRAAQVSELVSAMQSGRLTKAEARVVTKTMPECGKRVSAALHIVVRTPAREVAASERNEWRCQRVVKRSIVAARGACRRGSGRRYARRPSIKDRGWFVLTVSKLDRREHSSQLMASLSSLRSNKPGSAASSVWSDEPPKKATGDDLSRELREAEMWAELRSGGQPRSATPEQIDRPKRSQTPAEARRRRPQSAPRPSRRRSEPSTFTPAPPVPFRRSASVARMTRRPAAESSEMSECTFRPAIKELPPEYGTTKRRSEHFLERVERWRLERDRALEKRVANDAESAMSECTFQPRISTNSRRSADFSRGADKRTFDQRLYDDDRSRRVAREAKVSRDSSARESRFADEHPFRPALVAARNDSIKPRYRTQRTAGTTGDQPAVPDDAKDCTFAPSVNGVRDDMDLAKSYLTSGVFDRLTRGRSLSATRVRANSDTGAGSADKQNAAKRPDIEKFWARQAAFDAKRARRLDDLRQSAQPQFKPALVAGRDHLASNTPQRTASPATSDFMDRLAVAARRRARRTVPTDSDPECTFSPTISKVAATRARRSVDELSIGDALRQETSRRLLRLKAEHDERTTHSFKPELLAAATKPNAQSKL